MATYNGWANYATWRVNLEIFDGLTAEMLTGYAGPQTVSELKDVCKEYAEEAVLQSSADGIARDYALAFLSDVDWWEIADHLVEEELA